MQHFATKIFLKFIKDNDFSDNIIFGALMEKREWGGS